MPITLITVPRSEAKNPPGLAELWIAPASSVATIGAPTAMDVSTITMVATEVFVELQVDPEASAMLTTEQPESEGGTGHVYTLDVLAVGNSSGLKNAIDTFDGVPLIIIGKTKDGIMEIYGEEKRGFRLRAKKEDATKPGNARGYRLTGSMDFDHLPYEFSGTIPV
jgi:hypothetical protein